MFITLIIPLIYIWFYQIVPYYIHGTHSGKYIEKEDLDLINRTNTLRKTYGIALNEFSNMVEKRAIMGVVDYGDLEIELKGFYSIVKSLSESWNIASSRVKFAIRSTIHYSNDIIWLFSKQLEDIKLEDIPSDLNLNKTPSKKSLSDTKKISPNLIKYFRETKDIDQIIKILLKKNKDIKRNWEVSRDAFVSALEMNTIVVEESYKKSEEMRKKIETMEKPTSLFGYVKKHLLPALILGTPTFYFGWMTVALPIISGFYTTANHIAETFTLPEKLEKLEIFRQKFNNYGDFLNSVTHKIDHEISSHNFIIDQLNSIQYDIKVLKVPTERRDFFINTYLNSLKIIESKTLELTNSIETPKNPSKIHKLTLVGNLKRAKINNKK